MLPVQGDPEQAARDAVRFTQAVPVDELVLSVANSMTTAQRLIDTAAALYATLRAAGI